MHEADTEATAKDIEDGSYYLAARRWYSVLYHTPVAERSYYIVVILLAIINGYFAINSFMGVFPLRPRIPFAISSDNVFEEMPHIIRMNVDKGETPNIAVMKYFLRSYVINRESYDISHFDLRYHNIWSQSEPTVRDQYYKAYIDPSNPYSPYREYTNKARRDINLISLTFDRGIETSHAQVVFEASVVSLADGEEINHTRWRADMTFEYTDFIVDQTLDQPSRIAQFFGLTGNTARASGEKHKVTPMTFMVSGYQVKELLE